MTTNALWVALCLMTNTISTTNDVGIATNGIGECWANTTATSGWNFVVEAKHLTTEEREYFNEKANAMRGIPFASVEMVAGEVKALDILREMQQIHILASNIVVTNDVVILNRKLKHAKQLRDAGYLGASVDVIMEMIEVLAAHDIWNEMVKSSDVQKELTTEWVGHPMISDNAPYTPSQGWLSNVEMGLRSDGVIVWRKKEK